jgi:hypothetical protein
MRNIGNTCVKIIRPYKDSRPYTTKPVVITKVALTTLNGDSGAKNIVSKKLVNYSGVRRVASKKLVNYSGVRRVASK